MQAHYRFPIMSPFGRAAGIQSATAPQGADFVPLAQLRFHAQNCPSPTFLHFFAESGSGAALVPASPDPLAAKELVDNTNGGARELGHTTGLTGGPGELRHITGLAGGTRELGHATALNLLPVAEGGTGLVVEETTLLVQSRVLPTPTTTPNADAKQTFPVKKKPPAPKQVNTARKHPRPKPTLPRPPQAPSLATPLGSGLPSGSQAPHMPAEAAARAEQSTPELPWAGQATTSRPALQISPSTLPPGVPGPFPAGAGVAGEAPTTAPASAAINRTNSTESEVHGSVSEESQETTTSTIITTTVTTTEPSPGKLHCLHRVGGMGGGYSR